MSNERFGHQNSTFGGRLLGKLAPLESRLNTVRARRFENLKNPRRSFPDILKKVKSHPNYFQLRITAMHELAHAFAGLEWLTLLTTRPSENSLGHARFAGAPVEEFGTIAAASKVEHSNYDVRGTSGDEAQMLQASLLTGIDTNVFESRAQGRVLPHSRVIENVAALIIYHEHFEGNDGISKNELQGFISEVKDDKVMNPEKYGEKDDEIIAQLESEIEKLIAEELAAERDEHEKREMQNSGDRETRYSSYNTQRAA